MESKFCSFQWTDGMVGINNGTTHFCCKTEPFQVSSEELKTYGTEVFLNHPKTIKIRESLLNNQKPASCSYCWKLEARNLPHNRIKSTPIEVFFKPEGHRSSTSEKITVLEIVLSNLCQMQCVYCSPRFSSQWERTVKEKNSLIPSFMFPHLDSPVETDPVFIKKFVDSFFNFLSVNSSGLEEINFIGGEPLIQKDFFEILEHIEKGRGENTRPLLVRVVTNLSVSKEIFNNFLKKIESLKSSFHFILSPSIDSPGSSGEYIRQKLSWSAFKDNLNMAVETQLFEKVEFINTVNVLSLLYLNDFLKFYDECILKWPNQRINLILNPVNNPSFLNSVHWGYLLMPIVGQSLDWIRLNSRHQYPEFQEVYHFLISLLESYKDSSETPQEYQEQLKSWLLFIDKINLTQYQDVFPDLEKFLAKAK